MLRQDCALIILPLDASSVPYIRGRVPLWFVAYWFDRRILPRPIGYSQALRYSDFCSNILLCNTSLSSTSTYAYISTRTRRMQSSDDDLFCRVDGDRLRHDTQCRGVVRKRSRSPSTLQKRSKLARLALGEDPLPKTVFLNQELRPSDPKDQSSCIACSNQIEQEFSSAIKPEPQIGG
jgi:hypothetical protein